MVKLEENLIVIGDIHIAIRQGNETFEDSRLIALSQEVTKALTLNGIPTDKTSIVLAGDTFDKDSPSIQELNLFYKLIANLRAVCVNIVVIGGNHDPTVFSYIPKVNFIYLPGVTTIASGDFTVTLVPWAKIKEYTTSLSDTLGSMSTKSLLISHARCTLGEHIQEEVDIQKLSKNHPVVILGDIHKFHKPYPNVYYTSSPSNNNYTPLVKGSHGFLLVSMKESIEITEVPITIPSRVLIVCEDYVEADTINSLSVYNLYKIKLIAHIKEFEKYKKYITKHIKFEFIPKLSTSLSKEQYQEHLARTPIEQLYAHMKVYRFDQRTEDEALRIIRTNSGSTKKKTKGS